VIEHNGYKEKKKMCKNKKPPSPSISMFSGLPKCYDLEI
jgi:hypothetical protein